MKLIALLSKCHDERSESYGIKEEKGEI